MRKSLESSYELKAAVQDETLLLEGIGERKRDYVKFTGYLRNEGRRRFRDITDLINQAVRDMQCCDSAKASSIYLETLKAVLLQTRWARILETYSDY
ncbi:MAG: hypothetical protein OEV85_02775 [Candidatus Thorarchaeota archaeon]|nr:hypothetical protein [Candidatus Thorarchaeota archaeon]